MYYCSVLSYTVEISLATLVEANLTTLLDWMQWLEDTQTRVTKMKEIGVEECEFLCKIHLDELICDDNEDAKVDAALHMLKHYQQKVEEELRKPVKSWNYPPT